MGEQRAEETRVLRHPAVAGMFYSGSRSRLESDVDAMLEEAPAATLSGRILGLIEPHAGLATFHLDRLDPFVHVRMARTNDNPTKRAPIEAATEPNA